MADAPKIMESWEFAEIENSFRKRIIDLMDDFVVAIDEDKLEEMRVVRSDAVNIITEYYETAEDLVQYGTGLKKTQFLEASEDDVVDLKELIEQADGKLASSSSE